MNGREGRLEVFRSETWGTVCSDRFGDISAKVVCNQLGFGYVVRMPTHNDNSLKTLEITRNTFYGTCICPMRCIPYA